MLHLLKINKNHDRNLLTVIIILLIINIVIALTKTIVCKPNVWKDCYARNERKPGRTGKNIRELRNELNQTLNYSIRNMQDTLHKNLLTGNEMQRENLKQWASNRKLW